MACFASGNGLVVLGHSGGVNVSWQQYLSHDAMQRLKEFIGNGVILLAGL
jgi:hypothetical protein